MGLRYQGGSQRQFGGNAKSSSVFLPSMNFGQVQALRGTEDDHRVERTSHVVGLSGGLDVADLVEDGLEQLGETTVDRQVILVVEASDELVRLIAHAVEELVELFMPEMRDDGRVGDLVVAVEVQNRQHDTVGARVDELVDCQPVASGPVSSFAVADDGRDGHAAVHHSAVGVDRA